MPQDVRVLDRPRNGARKCCWWLLLHYTEWSAGLSCLLSGHLDGVGCAGSLWSGGLTPVLCLLEQIKRVLGTVKVKNDFKALLLKNGGGSDRELVLLLADLLEKMMVLDPAQRIDLDAARRHPFLRKILQKSSAASHSRKDTAE